MDKSTSGYLSCMECGQYVVANEMVRRKAENVRHSRQYVQHNKGLTFANARDNSAAYKNHTHLDGRITRGVSRVLDDTNTHTCAIDTILFKSREVRCQGTACAMIG